MATMLESARRFVSRRPPRRRIASDRRSPSQRSRPAELSASGKPHVSLPSTRMALAAGAAAARAALARPRAGTRGRGRISPTSGSPAPWRGSTRSRIGDVTWLLPVLAAALLIVGLARPQLAHGRTEVTANGIDIMLGARRVGFHAGDGLSGSTAIASTASTWSSRWCRSSSMSGPTTGSASSRLPARPTS